MRELIRCRHCGLTDDPEKIIHPCDGCGSGCWEIFISLEDIKSLGNDVVDLRKRLSREERAHLHTIDERDSAEDALADAFRLVTGRNAEWSNLFGYADALAEINYALLERETNNG